MCEYCKKEYWDRKDIYKDYYFIISINKNNEFEIQYFDDYKECEYGKIINYCPMCGRKL